MVRIGKYSRKWLQLILRRDIKKDLTLMVDWRSPNSSNCNPSKSSNNSYLSKMNTETTDQTNCQADFATSGYWSIKFSNKSKNHWKYADFKNPSLKRECGMLLDCVHKGALFLVLNLEHKNKCVKDTESWVLTRTA